MIDVIWCTVHHSIVLISMLFLSCSTNALLKNHIVASGLSWNYPHGYRLVFPDQVTQRTVLKSNLPALSDSHLILCDSGCDIIPAALTSVCTAAKARWSHVSPRPPLPPAKPLSVTFELVVACFSSNGHPSIAEAFWIILLGGPAEERGGGCYPLGQQPMFFHLYLEKRQY